jgi:DNA-binding SARP family transcriptional activator
MHSQADAAAGGRPRFLILGPLTVCGEDGTPVPVSAPLQRRVLATLLLHAGQPCTGRWLARAVWGENLPGDPGETLRTVLRRLRRSLGPAGSCLKSPDNGYTYMFSAGDGEVDAGLFEDLASRGRIAWYGGDTPAAAGLFAAAARLWQAPALADVPPTAAVTGARDRLLRAREDVEDLWRDARLALGGHSAVIGEMRDLLGLDPLREHAWAQLMVALYRDGRPAEALAAFRQAEAALHGEYGTGPGPELTELRGQITAGRTELLAAPMPA